MRKRRSLISKFPLKIADFFAVFFQNFANVARILLREASNFSSNDVFGALDGGGAREGPKFGAKFYCG